MGISIYLYKVYLYLRNFYEIIYTINIYIFNINNKNNFKFEIIEIPLTTINK